MSPGAVRWVEVEVKTAPGPRPVSDYEFASEAQLSLNNFSFPGSRLIQPNTHLRPHFFSSSPNSPTGNRGRVRTVTLTLSNQPLSDYSQKSTRFLRRTTSTPHFQPTLNHSVPLPYRPTLSTSALAAIPSLSTRSRLAPDKPHFLGLPQSSNSPPCPETTFDALPAPTSLQPNNQSSNLIHRLIRRASSVFPLISDMSTSHSTPTLLDRTQNAYDHQLHSRFQTLGYLSTTREFDQSNLLSPQLQTSLSSSTASAHTALDTLPIPESNDRYTGNRSPDSPSSSARSRLRTPSLLLFGRSLPRLPQPHDTRPPSPSQAQEMLERSRSLPTTKELASTLPIGGSEALDPQPPLLQTSSASQRGSFGKGASASVRSSPHFAKGRIGSPIAHVNQTTRLQSSMGSSEEPEAESDAWKLKPQTDAQASLDHQAPPPAQNSHNRPTLPAPRFPSRRLSVDDDQAEQRAKDVNHAYRSSSNLSHQHRNPPSSPPSTESFSLSQHSLTGVFPEEPQPSRSGLDLRPRISPRASVSSGTFQNLIDVNSLPRPNTTKASKSASSGVSGLVGLLSKKFKPKLKGRRSSSVSAAKLASKSTSSIVHPTSPNVLPPMPSTRYNACSSDIGHYSLPHAPKSESTLPSRAGPNRSRAPKSELIHQAGHSLTSPDLLPPVPSEPSSELLKLMASSLMRPIPTPKPSLHYIPQSEMDEPEPLESEPESEVEAEVPQTDISDHSQPALKTHQEGESGGGPAFQLPALPPPISPFEANFLPPRRSQSASPEIQKRAVGGTVGPARLEVPNSQGVATPDILDSKGLQNSTELRRPVDPLSALSTSTSYLSSSFEHLPGSSQLEVDTPATHVSTCSQLGSETNEADEDEGSYNLHSARTHLSQDPDSHWCEGLSSNTQLSPSLPPPVQLVSATDDHITPHSELTTYNSEPKDESVDNTTVKPVEQKSVSSTATRPNYPEAVTPWEYQDVHHVQFVDGTRPQDRRMNSVKITTQDQGLLSTRNSAHQRVTPFPNRGNSSRRGSVPPSQMTAVAAGDSVARGTDDLSRSGQEPSRRKSQSSNEGGTGPDLFLHLNGSVSSTSSSGGTIAKLFKANNNSSRSRLYRWSFSSPTVLPDNNPSPLLAPTSILTSSSVPGREQLNRPALASSQPESSPSGVRGSRNDVAGRPSRTRRMSSVLSVGTQSNALWRSQSDSMSPSSSKPLATSTTSSAKPKSQPAQGLSRIVRSQSSANLSSPPLVRPSHTLGRGDASPLLAFTRRLSCNISSPTLAQVKVGPAADENLEAKDLPSAPQPLCTPSESISTGPEPVKALDSPLKLKLLPREKGESEVSYLERLGRTMEKSMIVSALGASSDPFHASAIVAYLDSFEFAHDPIDLALRKLLLAVSLPKETQQIDRVMEAFSKRYMACNPKLYGSSDQVYVLAFSIIMLHTDAFNKHNRAKMSRADYVKNTRMDGIPNEVLEYIYDNVTYTQFIFVDEERDITGNKIDNLDTTGSFFHLGASTSSNNPGTGSLREKTRADPYTLIARGLTHELRPDIEALIPSRNPFSFTGTVPYFDSSRLRRAFGGAVTFQIVNGLTAKPSSALARLTAELPNEPMVDEHVFTNLRAVKVGLAYRKDEGDGLMKNVTRKWREWCVVLTGSQLLFMKDTTLAEELQQSFVEASRRNTDSSDDQLVVRITGLKPDSVFSLEDGIALMDVTYTRRPNTFRLILAKDEQQYLMEVPDEIEMNAWITHINYAATFKSVGVPFRSSQLNDPNSFSRSTSSLAGIISTTIERQARVSTSSSVAGRSGYEEDVTNDRVSGTRRGSVSNKPWPINRHSFLRDGPITRSQNLYNEDPQMVVNGSTPNVPRYELIKSKIEELEQEILKAKADLNEDLRIARNLAVLTPFQVSTRTRLQQAIVPISHRIRVARHHLSRLVCYREILLRDNILDKPGATGAVVGEQTETVALTDRSEPAKTTSFLDPFPAKADREPIGQLALAQGPLSGPSTSQPPPRSSSDQTRKGSASKLAEVCKQITQIPNPTRDYRSYSSSHTSRLALPTDGPLRSVPSALSQLIPEAEFPPSTPTVPVPTPTPLTIGPSSPGGASPVHASTHIAPSKIFIPRSPVESTSRSRRRPSTANTMGSATTHNANGSVLSAISPPKRFTQAWGLP